MKSLLELAVLLEEAAKALRGAAKELDRLRGGKGMLRLEELSGYGAMSVRAQNCLMDNGVLDLGSLTCKTANDLREMRNLGETTLREIREFLAANGECLKGEVVNGRV